MSSPAVLLRGTLAQRRLPELLVILLDKGLAGTLVLQEPDGAKSAVLFVRGAPGKARLARPETFLGDVLQDLGILTEPLRQEAVAQAREEGRHLGQLLVSRGLIDDTSLYVALREQLHRQILSLCELPPETAFGLYQANYLDRWGPSPDWRVKPLPLVWRALSEKMPLESVKGAVERLGDRKLRLRVQAPVARYHLSREELAVINVLRAKPQSWRELLDCGVGRAERIFRTVYALCQTRQLDLGVELAEPVGYREPPETPQSIAPPAMPVTEPPGPRSVPAGVRSSGPPSNRRPSLNSPPPAAAKGRSPEELAAFRAEVEGRHELEHAITYYEVLGVDPQADAAAIRAAFFQLAKRWHPDRLGPELQDLQERVTGVFARMTEAHQVLSDALQRKQYDEALSRGEEPEEQEQVMAVLRAATAYRKAEVLMKKRDDKGALREAKAAYEGDPEQAEYAALYAWLEARHRTDKYDDLVEILDDAVRREPDNVFARWYRGQLYKKVGREAHAMRDFRHVVALNPHHVEAQRELRVYEMRRKAGKAEGGAGLFGRWRKKQ